MLLVFDMLEPEGMDGALAWGLLGAKWAAGDKYPIYKVTLAEASQFGHGAPTTG